MIIGIITYMTVGTLCVILGLLLVKKQMVSILHDYHYKNVKAEDIPAYTRRMGVGLIIIGSGIIITGIFEIFVFSLWWLPLTLGFIVGLAIIIKAKKK